MNPFGLHPGCTAKHAGWGESSSYWVSESDPLSKSSRVFRTGQSSITNDPTNDRAVLREYVEVFGLHNLILVRWSPVIAGTVDIARSFFELRTSNSIEGDLSRTAIVGRREDLDDVLVSTLLRRRVDVVGKQPPRGPASRT